MNCPLCNNLMNNLLIYWCVSCNLRYWKASDIYDFNNERYYSHEFNRIVKMKAFI